MDSSITTPNLQETLTEIIDAAANYKDGSRYMPDAVVDRFLLMKCLEAFGEAAGRTQHAALSSTLLQHTAFDVASMRSSAANLTFLLEPVNA